VLRLLLGFAILCALAACAAFLFWPRTGAHQQLFDDILAEQRSADARPAHVPPLPGSFGDLLAPHLAALHESHAAYQKLSDESRKTVARIYNGEAEIGTLPPAMAAHVERYRPAFEGALRASHAETGRAPKQKRIYHNEDREPPWGDLQHAALLAVLDVLVKASQGRADEAAAECADILAFARDVSYPSLIGRLDGVAMTGLAAPACARALSEASPAAAAKTGQALKVIHAGTPRFSVILERESIYIRLRVFSLGSFQDEDRLLPGEALYLVTMMRQEHIPESMDALRETAWGPLAAAKRDELLAQSLPWSQCAERMESIRAERFGRNLLLRSDAGLALYLRRHRDGLLKLDALAGLAAHRAGLEWQPSEPHATCGEQSAPLRVLGETVEVTLSDGKPYALPVARAKTQ
jgi:hypothetical protein